MKQVGIKCSAIGNERRSLEGTGIDGSAQKMKTSPMANLVETFTLRPLNPRVDRLVRPADLVLEVQSSESHEMKQGHHEHLGGRFKSTVCLESNPSSPPGPNSLKTTRFHVLHTRGPLHVPKCQLGPGNLGHSLHSSHPSALPHQALP